MGRLDPSLIHIRSGFNPITRTFYTTRPPVLLPSENTPFSAAGYALSCHLHSTGQSNMALIQSSTGIAISYTQFRLYVDALAVSLRTELGLRRNDVAFVLSPNSTTIPILYFALLSIGVTVCPANPVSVGAEISRQIKISKPSVAFATSMTVAKLLEHGCRTILIDSAEFEQMMARRPAGELSEVEVHQDDVAAILFSSGTTGQVKGVVITHRNLIAITAEYYQLREERSSSPVVGLYAMPYFHILGFHFILKSVALAETVVVMERFQLAKMLAAVEKFKVTNLAVVPPIVVAMVKSNLTEKFEMGSLETVRSGAAPLGMDLFAAFSKKFPGIYLYQGYGMTETSGTAFRAIGPEEYVRWGSVGKLVSNAEVKIVDLDTGEGLPPGKPGELWIKGVTVMKGDDISFAPLFSSGLWRHGIVVAGYVDNPKANSDVWAWEDWLRTGDICYVDDEGFLFVVDRLKELIKYKGYQVPPAELEQLLLSHPDISDAAVIPYPDKEAGQVPLALVVLRHPQCNVDQRQIIDFIEQRVAPYKKIRKVVFVDSIPKTASGKILRTQLLNTLQSNL